MIQNLFRQAVNILRPTGAQGNTGGLLSTTSTVYTGVPCAIYPVSATWKIYYLEKAIEVTNTITFAATSSGSAPTIKNGDTLVAGSRTYLVEGVRNLEERGRVVVVDARELT